MLTTLTVYAYVMGEITNTVMDSDAALVQKREEVARVQTFIQKHGFPPDLAQVLTHTTAYIGGCSTGHIGGCTQIDEGPLMQ